MQIGECHTETALAAWTTGSTFSNNSLGSVADSWPQTLGMFLSRDRDTSYSLCTTQCYTNAVKRKTPTAEHHSGRRGGSGCQMMSGATPPADQAWFQ